jgi:DNA polymerase-1
MTIAAKEGAHLDYETAKAIVDVDRKTYTGYWQWFERTVAVAKALGYSETLFGRRRYNTELFSHDDTRRGHAERAAANHVVQGTAADIIKLAMQRMVDALRYYSSHLAVQVHDELVFWVPEYNAKAFLIAAKGIMESVEIPHLKLVAEGGIGKTWAEAHA